ncbi:hypothetical protein VTI74DRAFT_3540 [Chaetomium olivicolor]
MRAPENWLSTFAPALVLLGLHAAAVHGSRSTSETAVTAAPAATEVCESRTINYITHTLPQQCLRTSWTSPTLTSVDSATAEAAVTATATTVSDALGAAPDNGTAQDQEAHEELAASSFMSFEEWKEMMLRKSGQDPANIKAHKQREHKVGRDPGLNSGEIDSFGEEGEISLDFDALSEKVSEITSSSTGGAAVDAKQDVKEEQILYDDGKTQYYRSKDAGKTCKERFSYSSFDAGATVLKTSPGAKNAKAILVENKDSYMLLECRTKNKFVIVELSDDILVDTVVLANFEFFSSMIRKFRVSVSDRYPVKLDKWVDLGTFEARNSRDIQAFLIEHPQIYTKYIRIEFLSHWGNEFYCPVSLLRVHGTRMLDTWKEPSHDDEPEQLPASPQEQVPETSQMQEPAAAENSSAPVKEESIPQATVEMGLSPWQPVFQPNFPLEMCELRSPTTVEPTPVDSGSSKPVSKAVGDAEKATSRPSVVTGDETPRSSSSSEPASPESYAQGQPSGAAPPAAPSPLAYTGNYSTASNPSQKQPDPRTDSENSPSSTTTPTSRNKTSSAATSPSASPTVQESFFKTVTKRLQLLESNTSLSLQYIEEQSRFLQEVLLKMERKQITRVDSFLDSLNKTVLSELRNVRTQYDQIWQSTVIALETQREQSQREIVALTSRLNVLADEVVFQKRMAIFQSVLLLACLLLVIFSTRGGTGNFLDNATFPMSFPQTAGGINSTSPSPTHRRYNSRFSPSPGHLNYGYYQATGTDSLSASPSPPDHNPSAAAAAASNRSNRSSALAASALPRRLYSAPPTNTSSLLRDKILPLTPPSEHSRESTPATTRNSSSSSSNSNNNNNNNNNNNASRAAPSFYSEPAEEGREESGDGTPPLDWQDKLESEQGTRLQTEQQEETVPNRPRVGDGPPLGEGEGEERAGDQEVERPPLLLRPRSTASQLGVLKKPLPALPEDPS